MIKKPIKIKLILVAILLLFLFIPTHPAIASSGGIIVESNPISTNGETTVSVYIDSLSTYNAVDININFGIQEYISSTANTVLWNSIAAPSVQGNILSYAGAKLGDPISGKNLIITIQLRSNNSSPIVLTVSGDMVFTNAQGNTSVPETSTIASTFTVNKNQVLPNTNKKSNTAIVWGMTITLCLIGLGILIANRHSRFRHKAY